MGFSRAEFLRLLPGLFGGALPPWRGDRFVVVDGHRTLEIVLAAERQRVLSPVVRLPVTDVELLFTGYTAGEIAAFLGQFERQYLKGGG